MLIGDVVIGKVTGIKPYGAFVEFDQGVGLIHISEFSDQFVPDISKIVDVGEKVVCEILEFDNNTNRYKLSYKKCNVIPSKLHEHVKITKGFNSLGINLDNWIEEATEKFKKEKENE